MANTNRKNATETITNLAVALDACGIKATVTEDANQIIGGIENPYLKVKGTSQATTEEKDAIVLLAEMWNCNDGGTDRLEVWAEDRTNYTIEKCVNSLSRD